MMDASDWGRIKAKIDSPMTSDRDKEIYTALWDLKEGQIYAATPEAPRYPDTPERDQEQGPAPTPEGSEGQGEDPQTEATEAPPTVVG